jgi:hypothetical protein
MRILIWKRFAQYCGMEMAIAKLKRHKSPGIEQIPAEFIKAGVGQFAVGTKTYSLHFEQRGVS